MQIYHGIPEEQEMHSSHKCARGMQREMLFELGFKNEDFMKDAIAEGNSRQGQWPHGSMSMHSMFRASK